MCCVREQIIRIDGFQTTKRMILENILKIEDKVGDFERKCRENKLRPNDLLLFFKIIKHLNISHTTGFYVCKNILYPY